MSRNNLINKKKTIIKMWQTERAITLKIETPIGIEKYTRSVGILERFPHDNFNKE